MADNGGSSRGGGRGGRGGGSTRGGGARSRRGRGGSSRQQGGPTASTGGGRGGRGGNNTPVYRAIGDETTDKIGREVSELVMSSRPDDCSKLEVICLPMNAAGSPLLLCSLTNNNGFDWGRCTAEGCKDLHPFRQQNSSVRATPCVVGFATFMSGLFLNPASATTRDSSG